MASLTAFIERRLRLKVNEEKSAVARPEDRHFLGFRLALMRGPGPSRCCSRSAPSATRCRGSGSSPEELGKRADRVHRPDQRVAAGLVWVLRIVSPSEMQALRKIDSHLRRRLRAIQLRHWRRKRTIARELIKLGVKRESVWRQIYAGRKSWWALSHTHAVDQGLRTRTSPSAD